MQSSRRKSNIASALLILALTAIASAPFLLSRSDGKSREAVISVEGEILKTVPIGNAHGEERFVISTVYGKNHIVTNGASIRVEDADCPERVCVRSGAISSPGDIIACIPHRLIIEIKEKP